MSTSESADSSASANKFFQSVIDELPPLEQWSDVTIKSIRSAIRKQYPRIARQDRLEWTQRIITAILQQDEGWTWERLRVCSNEEYFSLPLRTITLMNALFHAERLSAIKKGSVECLFEDSTQFPISYPIFRADYSDDAKFELYRKRFDEVLEETFRRSEDAENERELVQWHWIDNKAKLDGKGPNEIREVYQELYYAIPSANQALWNFLMVDKPAIESMLRVYGPPASSKSNFGMNSMQSEETVTYVPFVVAVDTGSEEDDGSYDKENIDDREFHGHFRCAVESIFDLWSTEQALSPDEIYPRDRGIWGGLYTVFYPPSGQA